MSVGRYTLATCLEATEDFLETYWIVGDIIKHFSWITKFILGDSLCMNILLTTT